MASLIPIINSELQCPHSCCTAQYKHRSSWTYHIKQPHSHCNSDCSFHKWKIQYEEKKRASGIKRKPDSSLDIIRGLHEFNDSQLTSFAKSLATLLKDEPELLFDPSFAYVFIAEAVKIQHLAKKKTLSGYQRPKNNTNNNNSDNNNTNNYTDDSSNINYGDSILPDFISPESFWDVELSGLSVLEPDMGPISVTQVSTPFAQENKKPKKTGTLVKGDSESHRIIRQASIMEIVSFTLPDLFVCVVLKHDNFCINPNGSSLVLLKSSCIWRLVSTADGCLVEHSGSLGSKNQIRWEVDYNMLGLRETSLGQSFKFTVTNNLTATKVFVRISIEDRFFQVVNEKIVLSAKSEASEFLVEQIVPS